MTAKILLLWPPGWQLDGQIYNLHYGCLEVIDSSLPCDCEDSATFVMIASFEGGQHCLYGTFNHCLQLVQG